VTDQKRKALVFVAGGVGLFLAAREAARRLGQYDLGEKVVLITGGSRGLGLVLAREAIREGARVAICARDPEELETARADLAQRGEVLAVPCDVTDRGQVDAMVESVRAHFGQIDVLINNAGAIQVGPMEVMTFEDYERAMAIHFWGPLYTTFAVLPEMQQRRSGRIVNISSIGGKVAVPHLLPYSASKFALVGLRAEVAKDGVSVTSVCPGLMRTGSPLQAEFKGQNEAEYAWFTIADSLPGSSVSAETAARQILAACKRGDAELVISLPAQLAALFHGIFPGLTADLLGVVNRALPEPGGIGTETARGRESESPLTRSILTLLTRRAAAANNEA
jgi:NAD(P)-dependent dehydrogenase (short-subunit alcohol dehydrogenase family)